MQLSMMFLSPTCTFPLDGDKYPVIIFRVVLLPAPFAPKNPTISLSFKENDIEFINSIPFNFNLNDKITIKKPILSKYEILLKELFLMFDSRQIYEGGFFVMIGKKKEKF